ncbi:MAG: sigma 54-interacting transcriptional regulator [bacterium]
MLRRKKLPPAVPGEAYETLVDLGRGELADQDRRTGHTLVWLWPEPAATGEPHAQLQRVGDHVKALELLPAQSLVIRRGVTDTPILTELDDGWDLCVPLAAAYADVSRTPTRITLTEEGRLVAETEARGAKRFWLELNPVDGPSGAREVPAWSAVGVGPVVLWYVPLELPDARMHISAVDTALQEAMLGFRCYSLATAELITHLRRRAQMRMPVPKQAASEQWEATQPFILAGEPGCGKTTLAKAAYQSLHGSDRFAAVHPVAAEQEIDLVALMGSEGFAHDGVRVPNQPGLLAVATHDDGVVLIDEVHTLDDNLKKHLIDLLTEWTYRPRGDTTRRHRIRGLVVFATNRLDVLRDASQFPHDLFARMGGEAGVIELPPLRRRRWEVVPLARAVLEELEPALTFADNAIRKLLLHAWPLNHWELEDVVREAHSLTAAQGGSEIQPEALKVSPTGAEGQPRAAEQRSGPPTGGSPRPPAEPAVAWRLPKSPTWRELFQGIHHYSGFGALRDAWQDQLGAKNASAVNRRIGRLLRCDDCEPASCPRCFVGTLAQLEPEALLSRLEELSAPAGVPEHGITAWLVLSLRELVVERLEPFRTDPARAATAAAAVSQARADLLALLRALRSLIS